MAKAHATQTVTIANAATESSAANISPRGIESSLVGIVMPAAWTAATLTVKASNDGTTFTDMYAADGTQITIQAAANRWIALDPADFASVGWIKLVSSVAQGAARIITVIYRSVA